MSQRIWVDVLTPKQALFAKAMIERAPNTVELVVTTRDYDELNKFLKQLQLKHKSYGRHGGSTQEGKLRASIERMESLASFASIGNYDASFSFISPEASRVSFGLGIKHYVCSDSPHASAASRLTIPLVQKLFTPFPINKKSWKQYGIEESQVLSYHALDPWAWLLSTKMKRKRTDLIIIRLEESFASYMREGAGISSVVGKLVTAIKSSGDYQITVIPRYNEQRTWAKKNFGKSCIVPDSTIDARFLISRASLVIGGGGTMTQEAALLGVPNISYFPSARLDVFENFYFPQKLSVRAASKVQLIEQTRTLLKNIERVTPVQQLRAQEIVRTFEDPVKFIFANIS
ncbi:MAG: DUF354 domain-containing protein [Nitrososphaerales archaeon]